MKLARYPAYTGIDVSAKAVELCQRIFADDRSKQFLRLDIAPPDITADLALSLDVVYHLVENSVFDAYMRRLFSSARRFVIVYSSNVEEGWPDKHVRHRKFTDWVEQNEPSWHLHSTVKNVYPYDPSDPEQTSFADFYVLAPPRD